MGGSEEQQSIFVLNHEIPHKYYGIGKITNFRVFGNVQVEALVLGGPERRARCVEQQQQFRDTHTKTYRCVPAPPVSFYRYSSGPNLSRKRACKFLVSTKTVHHSHHNRKSQRIGGAEITGEMFSARRWQTSQPSRIGTDRNLTTIDLPPKEAGTALGIGLTNLGSSWIDDFYALEGSNGTQPLIVNADFSTPASPVALLPRLPRQRPVRRPLASSGGTLAPRAHPPDGRGYLMT